MEKSLGLNSKRGIEMGDAIVADVRLTLEALLAELESSGAPPRRRGRRRSRPRTANR